MLNLSRMSKNSRQNAKLTEASQVLQELLRSSKTPLGEQFIRWQVWNSWEEIVGPEVAKHTLPVSYLDGILYIWVRHPARLQELTFCAKPLLDKINAYCGHKWLKFLRFTLDRRSVPQMTEMAPESRDFIAKTKKDLDK
jgi:predicted nucleic acid-binding Zn ribbon protein